MENTGYSVGESAGVHPGLINKQNSEALSYVQKHMDVGYNQVSVLESITQVKKEEATSGHVANLVNFQRVNDIRRINRFFQTINAELEYGGLYIGCFESKEQRKKRILRRTSSWITYPIYAVDFIWKRLFPKLKWTQKFYFSVTKGRDRVLSLPEVLGRLASCGFEVEDYSRFDGMTYFTAKKTDRPAPDDQKPTYGPLITLKRLGFKGKPIKVYKIRTMHPFSEYLQDFIYKRNNLQRGGKFKNDFRITNWGRFLRKCWLDELPMFYNLFKGELKLVGVRPLSEHYFNLYPEEFQQRRLNYKPGLIPPFYADMPETVEEIVESERRYLDAYDQNPVLTDISYLLKSFYNIVIRRARSK